MDIFFRPGGIIMEFDSIDSLHDLKQLFMLHHLSNRIIYIVGILFVAAFVAHVITKKFKIPSVVGDILVGILFSIGFIKKAPFLSAEHKEWYSYLIHSFDYVIILAVSFISFIIGTELNLKILKKLELEFALIVLIESLATFALVTTSMLIIGKPLFFSLLLGAIATATAPAATVLVLKEYKARGELTSTLLIVLALDEALAIIIFSFVKPIALISISPALHYSLFNSFLIPLVKIVGSIVLGLNIGYFSQKLMGVYSEQKSKKILLLLATIFGGSDIAIFLGISPLITNLSIGFAFRNFSKKYLGISEIIDTLSLPLHTVFFILAGTQIEFHNITSKSFLVVALVYTLARVIGKVGGASLGAVLSKAPTNVSKYIGLGLLPQIGVSIDLAYNVQHQFVHFSDVGQFILNIILFTTIITEILGAIGTEYALSKSGEMRT